MAGRHHLCAPVSNSSGAAKKRAKKASEAAAANPPSLSELVEAALPSFVQRGQSNIYRSMLRAAVRKIDPVKPARAFGDKDEWTAVLTTLQAAGKLTYIAESDTVELS